MRLKKKISIIIPVYNVEDYLGECIESVLNQTYKDIEVILIDDGSTDKSPAICDQYSKQDDRIKVFHQENRGISATRNLGLKYATGEYIGWVDSDDIIHSQMYEILINNIIKESASISCCGYKRIKEKKEAITQETNNIEIISEELAIKMIRGNITCFLWDKLFSREVFKDIEFLDYKAGEDFLALMEILCKKQKVVKTDRVCYYYRLRENSLLNTVNIEGKRELLKSDYYAYNIINRYRCDDKKWMNYKVLYNNVLVHNQIKKVKSKEVKQFDKEIRKNLKDVLSKLPKNMNRDEIKNVLYAVAVIFKIK